MRPNWFFAYPVAGGFIEGLGRAPRALRWLHPDDVHLTLAFLGPVGEGAARRALEVLDHQLRCEPLPAVEFGLGAVVPMGSPRAFSALAALPADGASAFVEAMSRLRDPLTEAANGRKEKRAPRPHVTLARPTRAATEMERRAMLQWAGSLDLSQLRLRASRVALYTWTEVRRPRSFRIVEERDLPTAPAP